ncbi:ankyrin repeat-containing domain protein [Tricladium varicosporioides]|nr:ankyrin repeat-containing domain protein [Hymenoscyphus varicosporioides]
MEFTDWVSILGSQRTPLPRTNLPEGVSSLENKSSSSYFSNKITAVVDFMKHASAMDLKQFFWEYRNHLDKRKLGEGSTYDVYKCEFDSGIIGAVKRAKEFLPIASDDEPHEMELQTMNTMLTEMGVLSHPPLKEHPNLIRLLGYGWEYLDFGFCPFIVLEFANLGTLDEFLISRADKLSEADKLEICMDLLSGIEALHSCDITHGDIKLENILVTANDANPKGFTIKIADFSHCVVDSDEDEDKWILGTPLLAAPDVRDTIPSHFPLEQRKSCDIFSFGLTAWDCIKNGGGYFELHWIGNKQGVEAKLAYIKSLPKDGMLNLGLNFIDSLTDMSVSESEIARGILSQSIRDDWKERATASSIIEAAASKKCVIARTSPTKGYPIPPRISRAEHALESLGAASLPPWDIQKIIFAAMESNAGSATGNSTGKLQFDLSLCYLLGFGTSKDINKMLNAMAQSAMKGFSLAIKVVLRIHAACGHQLPTGFLSDSSDFSEVNAIEDLIADNPEYYTRRIQIHNSTTQASTLAQPLQVIDSDGKAISLFEWTLDDVKQFAILNEDSIEAWGIVVRDADSLLGTCSFLHFASFFGQIDLVKILLGRGFNVNTKTQNGRTPLYFASKGGKAEMVEYLLEKGADASIKDNFDISPLHWMLMVPGPVEDLCRKLHLSGADLNAMSTTRVLIPDHFLTLLGTPLHWAVGARHTSLIRALLALGADVDGPDKTWTPVQLAVSLHLSEELDILLQNGASIDYEDQKSLFFQLSGRLPIQRWLIHGSYHNQALKTTVLTLLKYGISIEAPDTDGVTPLVYCLMTEASDADIEIAAVLIENGANPHRRIGGYPVLHWAIIGSQPSPQTIGTLKLLVEKNVDINSLADEDHDSYTALHCAAEVNNLSAAKFLVGKGLNARARTHTGATPLHIAAQKNGSLEMIKALIDWGGSVDDVEDEIQLTVLGACLETPTTDASIIDYLVEQSTSMVVSERNRTILHLAAAQASRVNGRFLLGVLLKHKKVRQCINAVDSDGWTALHMAALGVDVYCTFILMNAGADVTIRTLGERLSAWDIVDLAMAEPSQSDNEEERDAIDHLQVRGRMIKDRLEEILEKLGVGPFDYDL